MYSIAKGQLTETVTPHTPRDPPTRCRTVARSRPRTDRKGIIVSGNDVFSRIAAYEESEMVGKPHSLIRHPEMPRCVFKLLWDIIARGEAIAAYVKNRASTGEPYWVMATVVPCLGVDV